MKGSAAGWNLLFAVSLLAVIGLLGFHVLVPVQPKPHPVATDLAVIRSVSDEARQKANAMSKEEAKETWDLTAERLGTRTLAKLTELAEKEKLKLSGFRIEKTPDAIGFQEATYVVVFEGQFPAVAEALKALENPDNKLAVSLFQVSSSDPDSDKVTATVSLVGFLPSQPSGSVKS